MREIKPANRKGWLWFLGAVVGVAVGLGVGSVMPGARCADRTSSSAIGRRGACSYHGGVSRGGGWIGVLAGLFAGVSTIAAIEALQAQLVSRSRESETREWERKQSSPRTAASLAWRPGGDTQAFLRRVMASGHWIAFDYRDDPAGELCQRTVRPRWLQLGEVAGERTLCLIGHCSVDGHRSFALSRMDRIQIAEPAADV